MLIIMRVHRHTNPRTSGLSVILHAPFKLSLTSGDSYRLKVNTNTVFKFYLRYRMYDLDVWRHTLVCLQRRDYKNSRSPPLRRTLGIPRSQMPSLRSSRAKPSPHITSENELAAITFISICGYLYASPVWNHNRCKPPPLLDS